MSNTIKRLFSELSLNRICIALFLLMYVGLYYPEFQKYITLSYGVLFLGNIYNLLKYRKLRHTLFVVISVSFVAYSYISVVGVSAIASYELSISQLLKSVLVSILFINLLNDEEDIRCAFFFISFAALVYAIIYVSNVDITMLGDERIATEEVDENLPNVNTVGLILSLGFSYFMFMLFKRGNIIFLGATLIASVIIFILGARKTIFSLIICVFMLFLKLGRKGRVGIIALLIVIIVTGVLIIPAEYLEFVYERIFALGDISSAEDSSDETRVRLLVSGIDYFFHSPIWGHGYYSFSQLFGRETGDYIYSHNNFIETLVGGGILAFILYYAIYYRIGMNLYKCKMGLDYGFLIFMVVSVLLFNHLTIVVLQERFIWLLLAIMWSGSFYYKRKVY